MVWPLPVATSYVEQTESPPCTGICRDAVASMLKLNSVPPCQRFPLELTETQKALTELFPSTVLGGVEPMKVQTGHCGSRHL